MAVALGLQPPVGSTKRMRSEPEGRRIMLKGPTMREQLDDISLTPSSDDPLRILAPGQKKLSTIESQRVLAVMEEAMKRLDGAMHIPILTNSLERYSISLGSKLVGMLKEYSHLISEYNQLYTELHQLGHPPNLRESADVGTTGERVGSGGSCSSSSGRPAQLEPLEKETDQITIEGKFQQTRFRLKHNIKCILREFHRNPLGVLQSPTASITGGQKNIALLQEEMSDLCGVLHEKLLTTHTEEVRMKDHLKQVSQRQKMAEQQISKLEMELAEEQKKREELLNKKDVEIKRLKSTIKGVINLSEDRNRKVKVDAHNQQLQDKQAHEARANKLEEEISLVRRKLQDATAEHRDKEQSLRKRAFKREMELENWIQKYDHEMGEKQDELEELQTEYETETSQLKELEEKLGVLSLEYSVVTQEQEEARRKSEENAQKMGRMARAARVIQRGWKTYMEKKRAMKGKKKGKKKKKGKGKGSGKGKKGKKKRK